ncbi:competence protein ComK [Domibacillus sp. 8LH]|uniref:Rok-like winged helix domain-containing protein n=1 Tax=Domibacillus TaxID=1433999 RepID=UPI00203FFA30|nr:competence protein ComK [Domibacillus indicus]MCM3788099.1 competence protein ComK [Domibacillus indicus]
MFNERMALKIRLDQLADAEVRVMQEFKKEREAIFARLQELDETEENHTPDITAAADITAVTTVGAPPKVRRGRRSEGLTELRDTTIRILKKQNTPIRGIELQRYVEEQSGKKIANMTTFMNSLERENAHVRKLGRGLYIYEYDL